MAELLQERRNLQDKWEHCFDTLGDAWKGTTKQVQHAMKDCELSDASDDQDA